MADEIPALDAYGLAMRHALERWPRSQWVEFKSMVDLLFYREYRQQYMARMRYDAAGPGRGSLADDEPGTMEVVLGIPVNLLLVRIGQSWHCFPIRREKPQ